MADIINMQEWVAKQQSEKGVFDFGKPYEELTELEVKFIVNHLKDMFNSLLKSMQMMQEIHKDNLASIAQLVENSNVFEEFKNEATELFGNLVENNRLTDERLDVHSDLLHQLNS